MEANVLDFVIDNAGDQTIDNEAPKDSIINNVFQQFMQEKRASPSCIFKKSTQILRKTSAFEQFSKNMDFTIEIKPRDAENKELKPIDKVKLDVVEMKKNESELKKVLAKSVVLQPYFNELHSLPSQLASDKKLRKERKIESEKTKGGKWFNMPATELTDEVKKDLQVLQMRSVLDPKHFYKKNDLKVLPKYFQVGKVLDSPLDYYNNRLTKKERKRTLVDELLADAEFNKYNKKKYTEILLERQKTHYKAYRDAKRLKRKKK